MTHSVVFHRLARADLFDLYDYVSHQAGPVVAGGYIGRIEKHCSALGTFPSRGTDRRDLGRDIRTLAMERRVLVVYRLVANELVILRVLYAGRDFSAADVPE